MDVALVDEVVQVSLKIFLTRQSHSFSKHVDESNHASRFVYHEEK